MVDAESLDKIINIDIVRRQLQHVDIVLLNKYAYQHYIFQSLDLSASMQAPLFSVCVFTRAKHVIIDIKNRLVVTKM